MRISAEVRAWLWAGLLSVAIAGPAAAKPRLTLKNLRAVVDIAPEDRADFAVSVSMDGSQDTAPNVSAHGDSVTIEGTKDTGVQASRVSFNLDRGLDVQGWKAEARKPQPMPEGIAHISIRAPSSFEVRSNAQVFAHIGASKVLTIHDNGRGEWRIDRVDQAVEVHGYGIANFHLAGGGTAMFDILGLGSVACGDVKSLIVDSYGAGDILVGRVAEKALINVSGIGDVSAQAVTGTLRVDMDDGGTVTVGEGEIAKLTVRSIDGRGAVAIGAAVGDADVDVGTNTRVHLRKVTGTRAFRTRDNARVDLESS